MFESAEWQGQRCRGHEPNRAEQARGFHMPGFIAADVLLAGSFVGAREASFQGQLQIARKTVDPHVGHINLKLIVPGNGRRYGGFKKI